MSSGFSYTQRGYPYQEASTIEALGENWDNLATATEVPNRDLGINCRSCNEFNKYAEVDLLTNDGKFTCWACSQHPERKRFGLPMK